MGDAPSADAEAPSEPASPPDSEVTTGTRSTVEERAPDGATFSEDAGTASENGVADKRRRRRGRKHAAGARAQESEGAPPTHAEAAPAPGVEAAKESLPDADISPSEPGPPPSAPDEGASSVAVKISDAFLLTTTDTGAKAVPGFSLHLDAAGASVGHADGTTSVRVPWSGVTRLAATETAAGPDDRRGLILEIVSSEGHHRFMVPTDEPGQVRSALQALPAWKEGRGRLASVALVVLLAVLIAAAITAGVLAGLGRL